MTFRSLTSLYHLICALNLAQLALGAWTLHSFGFRETGGAQLMLMFVALYIFLLMYLLTKYQRRAGNRLSRVREHITFLVIMVGFWLCADILAAAFLVVWAASCPPSQLLSLRCSPLALGLFLPLVGYDVFSVDVHAMRLIMARARAMYGEEMVPVPPSTPPPPELVPAWALGRIPGLELETGAECAEPAEPLSK
ncbi:hypothetical protein B0H14DRAFT_2771641 [Mycena olivaceomarginata]|nr:hypothetical protein B0H14DRAFT_2771641 [Mycena olivaceomarginata]